MFTIKSYMTVRSKNMLKGLPKAFEEGSEKGFEHGLRDVVADIKNKFTSASGLRIRSGKLRDSINSTMKKQGGTLHGYVGSTEEYAPTHEFGAIITPKVGDYLKFKGKSGWVSVKKVVIPRRPFLLPGIERNKEKIADQLVKYINRRIRYGF